ncbi:hypothetical protein [Paenibacillus ihumii]|uniref:hypothetical protein n=1 Tax=Paenibacillus ihumii TaxID=687436 RepID=UPI001CA312CD|nr:hypothetical protein [Paenibacillus ihumii]
MKQLHQVKDVAVGWSVIFFDRVHASLWLILAGSSNIIGGTNVLIGSLSWRKVRATRKGQWEINEEA